MRLPVKTGKKKKELVLQKRKIENRKKLGKLSGNPSPELPFCEMLEMPFTLLGLPPTSE